MKPLISSLSFIFLVLSLFPWSTQCLSSPKKSIVIKVCQNKDCIKRFPASSGDGGLIQTFRDLIPPCHEHSDDLFLIEPSGCLSQCGKGPNVSLTTKEENNEEDTKFYSAISDLQMASAVLEVGAGIDPPIPLMVAVEIIAKAARMTNLEKKVKLLNSVVKTLTKNDDNDITFESSTALAHALILRSDAYLEMNQIPNALEDINRAIDIDTLNGKAWRIKADAEESAGNYLSAIMALNKWCDDNPEMITKVKRDIDRLSNLSA